MRGGNYASRICDAWRLWLLHRTLMRPVARLSLTQDAIIMLTIIMPLLFRGSDHSDLFSLEVACPLYVALCGEYSAIMKT